MLLGVIKSTEISNQHYCLSAKMTLFYEITTLKKSATTEHLMAVFDC